MMMVNILRRFHSVLIVAITLIVAVWPPLAHAQQSGSIVSCLWGSSNTPVYYRFSLSSMEVFDQKLWSWNPIECKDPRTELRGPPTCNIKIDDTKYEWQLSASIANEYAILSFMRTIHIDRINGTSTDYARVSSDFVGRPFREQITDYKGVCQRASNPAEKAKPKPML